MVKKQMIQDKKLICFSFGIAFILTAVWSVGAVYSANIQKGIADKVVRFHVLANSDSYEDQQLKLCIRDRILEKMGPVLKEAADKEETKVILQESFPIIRQAAMEEINAWGYDYDVKVSLSKDAFPMKQYGDLAFPAGIYDALRVEIGSASGQNWWCVMFPPMCFVDATSGQVTKQSKQKLSETLSEEEYTVVSAMEQNAEIAPVIKFKIVEWWQERLTDNKSAQNKSAMQGMKY